MGYEKFYGRPWKHGSSLVLTIPDNIVKGIGIKEGDDMVLFLRKKGDTDGQ